MKRFHAVGLLVVLVGLLAGCRTDIGVRVDLETETGRVAVMFEGVAYEQLRNETTLVEQITQAVSAATQRGVEVRDNGARLTVESGAMSWAELNQLSGMTGILVAKDKGELLLTFTAPEEFLELLADAVADEVALDVYHQTLRAVVILDGEVLMGDTDMSGAPKVVRSMSPATTSFAVSLADLNTAQQVVIHQNSTFNAAWVGVGLAAAICGWFLWDRLRRR